VGNADRKGMFFFTVVFFGSLWGLVEASLGFILHLIPEILPVPSLSGIILFPVGLFFMLSAKRISGSASAIPVTAFIAAAIKVTSLALPAISFRFVRNPALAILSEGALAWLILGIGEWKVNYLMPIKAVVLSFGWRALFLGINIFGGLTGIANKPLVIQRQFIFLDGSIDALIIVATVLLSLSLGKKRSPLTWFKLPGPIPALSALVVGIGMQLILAGK